MVGPLEVPAGHAASPQSPSGQEQAGRSFGKRTDRMRGVTTTVLSPQVVDESKIFTDAKAQALNQVDGQLQTKPGQLANRAAASSNSLRFIHHSRTNTPSDGGWQYSPVTLMGNAMEERQEEGFSSGWHPKELRRNRLWDTEHTSAFVAPDPDYLAKMATRYAVAKEPVLMTAEVSSKTNDGRRLYYARHGFGDGQRQDHTSESKRGAYWVGVAPPPRQESVTARAANSKFFEFQLRTPCIDADAFLLGTLPPGGTSMRGPRPAEGQGLVAMQTLAAAPRLTHNTWRATYSQDYKDFSTALRNSIQLQTTQQRVRSDAPAGQLSLRVRG